MIILKRKSENKFKNDPEVKFITTGEDEVYVKGFTGNGFYYDNYYSKERAEEVYELLIKEGFNKVI